jgi:hypothetical protein
MYIAEIAPTQIRGALGSLHEMGIMCGILTVYGLGTDAVPFGWRGLSFTGVVPAAALLIACFSCPRRPIGSSHKALTMTPRSRSNVSACQTMCRTKSVRCTKHTLRTLQTTKPGCTNSSTRPTALHS